MTGIPLTRILATPRRAVTPHPLYRADDTLPAIASGDRRKRMGLDAAALRDIERRRLRALVQADMDTAAALHADDYQLITPRGYAMSKQEYLDRIASGRLRYRVFEPVSDIAVRGSGEVALLRYQVRISVAEDDDENGDAGDSGGSRGHGAMVDGRPSWRRRRSSGPLDPLDGGQPGLGERDAGPGLIALELGRLDPG